MALNADSLTELDPEVAARYADFMVNKASIVLSINHEINPFRAGDLLKAAGGVVDRSPYWMREGYVEEIVRTDNIAAKRHSWWARLLG